MRIADLLRESGRALRGSPTRTILTSLGITVGTMALTLIFALSLGLARVIDDLVATDEQLRHVVVMPGFGRPVFKQGEAPKVEGEMSDLKRQRLQRTLLKRSFGGPRFQMRARVVDADTEKALAAIPGVEAARPFLQERFELEVKDAPAPPPDAGAAKDGADAKRATGVSGLTLGVPVPHPYYPGRLLAGRWFASEDEHAVIVHEYLAYRLGFRSDEEQAALVGRTLRMASRKAAGGGIAGLLLGASAGTDGEVLYTEEVPIVGVIRERFGLERAAMVEETWAMQADAFVPIGWARTLWEKQPSRGGPQAVLLTARSVDDVLKIQDAALEMGLEVRTIQEAVASMQKGLVVMTSIASVLAGIAVFVAALGIVNTLVMSVLERTSEIGLLKALGATGGDVATLFLAEAALLGLGGGVLGTAAGWGLSGLGDVIGRRMIEDAFLMPFQGDLFRFPAWLSFAGVAFAVVVSVSAAILPTLRAARVDPVRALRHE